MDKKKATVILALVLVPGAIPAFLIYQLYKKVLKK